ncbi:hypothetical protein Patl1_07766 [Pistacia atlantica]|uniref:Uncharacterized protein n=1 Tax=Pistacia atlantica TaxID=434234 RepID=A0ACC1AKM9_9ROSI|nr:hypothetical protein Patl1_07766 [Pistacia atlantica]
MMDELLVLACEGSEMKGYMRKQASSKAIKKHMHNGGMSSFDFHPSPRMIPHIYQPEVQYVELSIERFISRGKKVKDNHAIETPVFKEKLTVTETDLIAKYFQHTNDTTSRLSLIAFPHFQAFPSRVHKVNHSYRTGMLIDMMQHLQGLTFSSDSRTFFAEDEVSSGKCLGVQSFVQRENGNKDSFILDNFEGPKSPKEVTEPELSPIRTLNTEKKHNMLQFCSKNSAAHSYLFGSDFVSVDALGKVLIVSLPAFRFQELSHSKCISGSSTLRLNHWKEDTFHLKNFDKNYDELGMGAKAVVEQPISQAPCIRSVNLQISSPNSEAQQEKAVDGSEKILETPILKRNQLNEEGDMTDEIFEVEIKEPSPQTDKYNDDLIDTELSPRLTNLIKSGVVPESPINDRGRLNNEGRNEFLIPDFASPVKLCSEQQTKSLSVGENKWGIDSSDSGRNVPVSPINIECKTPLLKVNHISTARRCNFASPVAEETKTSLKSITSPSCSRDWQLSSEDKSKNVKPVRKLKRLRKAADCVETRHLQDMKEKTVNSGVNLARSFSGTSPIQNKHGRGKRIPVDKVRSFIEEEAEVSSEAEISDDEEDDQDDLYEDSFIDDRINPTAASTQAESSGVDMVAIYRRSLLSQSPVVRQPNFSATYSPDCATPMTRTSDSRSSSGKTLPSVQTLQTESKYQSAYKNSESFQTNQERITLEASACKPSDLNTENERKRKLSFYQLESIPAINLARKFSFQSEATGKEPCQEGHAENTEADTLDDDDQFYEHLDLDAVEEQAALLLKQKSEFSLHDQETIPPSKLQNIGVQGSPSFDLGI